MRKDVQENDYSEYKLVRITNKSLIPNKKKIYNYKTKENRYWKNENENTFTDVVKNNSHNDNINLRSKKLNREENFSINFNDQNFNYSKAQNYFSGIEMKMDMNTLNKGKQELKPHNCNDVSYIKDNLQPINCMIYQNYKTAPDYTYSQNNFNYFYSNYLFMMQPMLTANKKMMDDFFKYNKNSENIKQQIFLNHQKTYLYDLSRNLENECRSINKLTDSNDSESTTVSKNDIIVKINKKLSDLSNDVLSNSTNLDIPLETKANPHRSMCVKIKLSEKEKNLVILIEEDSNYFEIIKEFCKENNLNQVIFFSIYKKIKSAMATFFECCKKSLNFEGRKSHSAYNLRQLSFLEN